MKKLEWRKRNILHSSCDMFPTFESWRPSNEAEDKEKLYISHLGTLKKQFSLHCKDLDISKREW